VAPGSSSIGTSDQQISPQESGIEGRDHGSLALHALGESVRTEQLCEWLGTRLHAFKFSTRVG